MRVSKFPSGFKRCSAKLLNIVQAQLTEEEAKHIVEEIDSSGSHKINYSEFIAATMKAKAFLEGHAGQEKLDAIFQMFDTTNHGKISAENIKNFMEKIGKDIDDAEIETTMNKFDKDKDGYLNK